jgi:hypothetical protein
MHHLIEQEIQEIEARTAAQVIDMESDDNALRHVYTNGKPALRL